MFCKLMFRSQEISSGCSVKSNGFKNVARKITLFQV